MLDLDIRHTGLPETV